jgi:HAD superfamily hydrolase (TIGR01509 family)
VTSRSPIGANDRPRAILIDLDGTLADSIAVLRAAYTEFLLRHGATGSDDEFAGLNGPPLSAVVRLLKAAHGLPADESELRGSYEDIIDRIYDAVPACAGAAQLFHKARSNNCLICVVTSNSAARTRRWLTTSSLNHFVDSIVAGEDVACGKPQPDPYLLALQRTASAPEDAIAIEDSLQGAQSAVSAGLRTFVVNSGSPLTAWPPGIVAIGSLHELATRLW